MRGELPLDQLRADLLLDVATDGGGGSLKVYGYDDATITIHDHADHAYARGNMKRFQTA